MILLRRRPGKNFSIVYCVLFRLTWFDDYYFLYVFS